MLAYARRRLVKKGTNSKACHEEGMGSDARDAAKRCSLMLMKRGGL